MLHRLSIFLAAAVGVVLLGFAALVSWPAWLTLFAGMCIGFAAGMLAGRTAARIDIPSRSPLPLPTKTSSVTLDQLNDLELRAKVRGDFETAGLVDRLQALFDRLRQSEATAERDELVLTYKLRKMYDNAADFCERALSLHLARREMATDEGRRKVDDQRQALVDEVRAAVAGIEAAIDRLRANAAVAGDAERQKDLADLNTDLDRRLEVARRVEARMSELEAGGMSSSLRV